MTDAWNPFHDQPRPTATSISDDTLDAILTRLERAETIVEMVSRRPPWQNYTEENTELLVALMREFLHRRHRARMTWITGVKYASAEQCRMCNVWARQFAWRWAARGMDLSEADEARLARVSHLIDMTHPTMAWPNEAVRLKARQELPWLMSVIRRLQRDVRRERGAYQAMENRFTRASDAESGLKAEVARLRKKLAEEI